MIKKPRKINAFSLDNMKNFKMNSLKEYGLFFWLILLSILALFVTGIYSSNNIERHKKIKSSLENIYLKKSIKELTQNLKPRYKYIKYLSKSGDTHQGILNKLKIDNKEKKILLETILNEKSLKILKINQKFSFKIDNLLDGSVIEFIIQTDKKNEILFTKVKDQDYFISKKIEKNFIKKIVYK